LMLADQMITILEYIHTNNVLHRDFKPENFLMGIGGDSNVLHLIDFGLAIEYRNSSTGKHILYRKHNDLIIGTLRFASHNAHLGDEQSRRDDLESIGYLLIFLMRGDLPWLIGLKADTKTERQNKIWEKKMSTSTKELCEGYPVEFQLYLKYCRDLSFDETPDYKYLRQLFRLLFKRLNYERDFMFDWSEMKKEEQE